MNRQFWFPFMLLAALVCAFGPAALAQTAEITGRITDPSGSIIPGTEVSVVNLETGMKRSTSSNDEGYYTVPLLQPGDYTVLAQKAGFKTASRSNVKLVVQQVARIDFLLEVGEITNTIEVTGTRELLQQSNSELGTVIPAHVIQELPLNGRNFTQLLTLSPGATPVSTSQSANVAGITDLSMAAPPTVAFAQPSVQGQWNRSNLYLLDGIPNTDLSSSVYAIPPSIDAIREFKVQSHNDAAEFGGVLGGVVNLISKSGTNNLHGSIWEFVRNDALDARDPFKDEFRSSPAPFRQNQFGATIGGPVRIPKVYNGTNKTFFLFGYDGWRYSEASQSRYYVPTDKELTGDFSDSIVGRQIFDPATTRPDPNNPDSFIRDPFPNNIVPSDRISPTTLKFIQTYFDRPNLSGDPDYNAINSNPIGNNANQYNIRIDHSIGSKDSLWFRYTFLDYVMTNPDTNQVTNFGNYPTKNLGLGWTHIFSPSLVVDGRYGFMRRRLESGTNPKAGFEPQKALGFPGTTTFSLSPPWGGDGIYIAQTLDNPVDYFAANLSWLKGSHNFRTGFQYIRQGTDSQTGSWSNYTFTDDVTGDPQQVGTTGASLASALLGLPTEGDLNGESAFNARVVSWAAYFQDTWKVSPRLTVNLGLRFDHRNQYNVINGTSGGYDMKTGEWLIGDDVLPPPCSQAGNAPCIPGDGTLSSIPHGDHIRLSPNGKSWGPNPEWTDFGPRIGVAWSITGKTVVRGGYGLNYDTLTGVNQEWKAAINTWPNNGAFSKLYSYNGLGEPPTFIEDTQETITSVLPDPDPWSSLSWYYDPQRRNPRSHQWNLEIQHQVTANLSATIGYVGSHNDRVPLTGVANTPMEAGPGTPEERLQQRPFPYITTPWYETDLGIGNYNALQFRLERRFADGVEFLLSYTWSKALDNGSSGWYGVESGVGSSSAIQNFYDLKGNYAVSGYDVPHFLSLSSVWELPFGKGKKWLKQGPGSWLLGDWQLNTIVQLRSGQPFNLSAPGDVANLNNDIGWWNYARPNLVGDPNPSQRTSQMWYNPDAFAVPVLSFGNFGRNVLRTASVYNADLSLFKNIPLGESRKLEVRSEFFNIFNIMSLGAPVEVIGQPDSGRVNALVNRPRQIQFSLRFVF